MKAARFGPDVAATLREEFDAAFARPREERADQAGTVDLLTLRVGSEHYVVRLDDVGSIQSNRTVSRLPGTVDEVAGVASVRGEILVVYDLGVVLGTGRVQAAGRWLLVPAGRRAALSFDEFGQYMRVSRQCLAETVTGDSMIRSVADLPGGRCPVLEILQVVDLLAAKAGGSARSEEES